MQVEYSPQYNKIKLCTFLSHVDAKVIYKLEIQEHYHQICMYTCQNIEFILNVRVHLEEYSFAKLVKEIEMDYESDLRTYDYLSDYLSDYLADYLSDYLSDEIEMDYENDLSTYDYLSYYLPDYLSCTKQQRRIK